MKVAIVHDWLTGMRGGEKCLEVFCELFPEATLYTLLHKKGSCSKIIESMDIKTSFLQKFPRIEKDYRNYLFLMPKAIETFNMEGYDLIISSSHCVAKGVKSKPYSLHICYCYTPMRYIWDLYDTYFSAANFCKKIGMGLFRAYLQKWDVESSKRVNFFIAISENVKERIKRIYNRDAAVIYPPVDTDFFTPAEKVNTALENSYYLAVSTLVPYKRIDLAIEAFNVLKLPLKIIGEGPEEKKLRKLANSNIEFLGWVDGDKLKFYYQNCKALIFPGEEDFGIVPVEAQACGKPVIAYKKGGVLETVIEGKTGVFFDSQTAESLISAVERFERMRFDARIIRQNAEKFNRNLFKERIKKFIYEAIGHNTNV
jgi:glycosyltransferase involved in cell wall biosynthesis